MLKMTATTGARCPAVGSNYFEGSMNLQIHWKFLKTLKNVLKQLFPGKGRAIFCYYTPTGICSGVSANSWSFPSFQRDTFTY